LGYNIMTKARAGTAVTGGIKEAAVFALLAGFSLRSVLDVVHSEYL